MLTSNRYNPFVYLRSETDVTKFVSNIFKNTDDKSAAKGEQFWDDAAKMLLKALVYYVWMEMPPENMHFGSVLDLLAKAEFKTGRMGQKEDSELDIIFRTLQVREEELISAAKERGETRLMHPAVTSYNSVMKGAADTVRSIIITLDTKLDNFKIAEVRDMLCEDEMNIPEIGCGVNMDGKTKTALFCVIPDTDSDFGFLIGALYTQIFQQLYFTADHVYGGRLPIHVTFLLDEFANVPLPDDYIRLLSTMRSREISSIIILQNRAQIVELYEKGWKSIPGNCDTQIFLGSGEEETGESISKQLGKGTIDKRTRGETKGKQGSSSRNYDRLGRELMMPEEVRLMDNKKCLVFIRGQYPCMDLKTITKKHVLYKQMIKCGGYKFDASKDRKSNKETDNVLIATDNEIKYMKTAAERQGRRFVMFECTAEEIEKIDTEKQYTSYENIVSSVQIIRNRQKQKQLYDIKVENAKKQKIIENNIKKEVRDASPNVVREFLKLKNDGYNYEQLQLLIKVIKNGTDYKDITEMFNSKMNIEEMSKSIEFLEFCVKE